jgi:hypothetical protein
MISLCLLLVACCCKSYMDSALATVPRSMKEMTSTTAIGRGAAMLQLLTIAVAPQVAHAEKGAFEMDMEYYVRDLVSAVKGETANDKVQEGLKTFDKKLKKFYGPARKMDESFASSVVDLILTKMEVVSNLSRSRAKLLEAVDDKIDYNLKYFKTFVPISDKKTVGDQYFFDIFLYTLYLEAGKTIVKSEDRIRLRSLVGASILSLMYSKYKQLPVPAPLDVSFATSSLKERSRVCSQQVHL